MDASEYLAFIPLLLYGLGLADLLSEWKRLFVTKNWYLPYAILTIILTETALYNVFIYIHLVEQMPGQSYFTYLSYLFPPFLFLMATNAFTPDKESDTKEYFIKQMPVFFSLLALFVASHFLYGFNEPSLMVIGRIVIIILIIILGYMRKIWVVYALAIIWILLFFVKGHTVSPSSQETAFINNSNQVVHFVEYPTPIIMSKSIQKDCFFWMPVLNEVNLIGARIILLNEHANQG